jgi:hypothetical protein
MTEVSVFGENFYCRPNRFAFLFNQQVEEARQAADTKRIWRIAYRAARSLLFPRHGSRCYFPCKCEMATEWVLRARRRGSSALRLPQYLDRFSSDDVRRASPFIRRFNPFFRKSFLTNFRRKDKTSD